MANNTDPGWIKNIQKFNCASSGEEARKALIECLEMLNESHSFKVSRGTKDWVDTDPTPNSP